MRIFFCKFNQSKLNSKAQKYQFFTNLVQDLFLGINVAGDHRRKLTFLATTELKTWAIKQRNKTT